MRAWRVNPKSHLGARERWVFDGDYFIVNIVIFLIQEESPWA